MCLWPLMGTRFAIGTNILTIYLWTHEASSWSVCRIKNSRRSRWGVRGGICQITGAGPHVKQNFVDSMKSPNRWQYSSSQVAHHRGNVKLVKLRSSRKGQDGCWSSASPLASYQGRRAFVPSKPEPKHLTCYSRWRNKSPCREQCLLSGCWPHRLCHNKNQTQLWHTLRRKFQRNETDNTRMWNASFQDDDNSGGTRRKNECKLAMRNINTY
jgi:hypothetical protein